MNQKCIRTVFLRRSEWFSILLLWSMALLSACKGTEIPDAALEDYAEAKQYYIQQNFDTSATVLLSITERYESFHQARFLLGKAYFMENRFSEAAEEFSKLIQGHPEHQDARLWHARSLMHLGQYEEAENSLLVMLSFAGEDPRIYRILGAASEAKEDYQKALEYYTRAAEFENSLGEVYLSIGRIYNRFRVYDKSLFYIEKALHVLPEDNLLYRPVLDLKKRVEEEIPGGTDASDK